MNRSIILKVLYAQDLWIWHYYFRILYTCNEINVIDWSPHIRNLEWGVKKVFFAINEKECKSNYLLANDIYPKFSNHEDHSGSIQEEALERSINVLLQNAKRLHKDIERAFEPLKSLSTTQIITILEARENEMCDQDLHMHPQRD